MRPARPTRGIWPGVSEVSHLNPSSRNAPQADGDGDPSFTAALLTKATAPAAPDQPCGELFERFAAEHDLTAVAVVDRDNRPVGLLPRAAVAATLAKPLMNDLYRRRPARLLMDPDPLTVDCATPLGAVSRLIAEHKPSALTDGFIITDKGRYYGVGSALDLMATSVALADLRAWQREEAHHKAEAANHAKTAFLANASHEIRTPLNAIMGFAELLLEEGSGPLGSPRYREYAADIVEGGRHLMELINDLLDLSKAEADKLELTETLAEPARIAAAAMRLVGERAAKHGVTLRNLVPRDAPTLLADDRKLRQMLLNLLSNAIKFTLPGGDVALAAEVAPDGGFLFSVADSGVGMTEDEMAQALEPWGQINHALNRKLDGSGLGLPLTKRLAELHGGRLEMSSRPGVGTTVRIYFPAGRVQHKD